MIKGIGHAGILVSNLDEAVELYCDLFGLEPQSLEAKGVVTLGRGPGFCFLHPKSTRGVLFELIQSAK